MLRFQRFLRGTLEKGRKACWLMFNTTLPPGTGRGLSRWFNVLWVVYLISLNTNYWGYFISNICEQNQEPFKFIGDELNLPRVIIFDIDNKK